MKKITLVLLISLLSTTLSFSQGKLGIKGGLNFNSLKDVSGNVDDTWSKQTGYHLGLAYQLKVPFIGLGIQPELLFVRQKTEANTIPSNAITLDYLTLPVNLQLGLDLLLFRPFVMVSPYISYAVNKGDMLSGTNWDNINRFDYGYGLGAGIDIWKLQISGKYNWGLGKLQSAGSTPINGQRLRDAKFEGFQLSVTVMF